MNKEKQLHSKIGLIFLIGLAHFLLTLFVDGFFMGQIFHLGVSSLDTSFMAFLVACLRFCLFLPFVTIYQQFNLGWDLNLGMAAGLFVFALNSLFWGWVYGGLWHYYKSSNSNLYPSDGIR